MIRNLDPGEIVGGDHEADPALLADVRLRGLVNPIVVTDDDPPVIVERGWPSSGSSGNRLCRAQSSTRSTRKF